MQEVFRTGLFVLLVALAGCGGKPPPPAPAPAPKPVNSAPIFTSSGSGSVDENKTGVAYIAEARDTDGDAVMYSLGGADASFFSIDPALGIVRFKAPPDFELPDDANRDNVYDLVISASDGKAQTAIDVRITVNDVVETFTLRRRGTGFTQPVFVTGAGDNSSRLFVVEKGGLIRILRPDAGAINATPFLDLSAIVNATGERGLLGLAFAPDYSVSGLFYVYVTVGADVEVRRYSVSGADPDIADAASADIIFSFTPISDAHLAGWIGFGPDGFLYVTIGDGNPDGLGPPDASNPAQDTASYQGKLLRIDVSGDDFPADPKKDYAIPPGNPFPLGGADNPEIFAYGLRNPFRASFDAATGDLLIGDVGEDTREEIDLLAVGAAGVNYGWVRFEGTDVLVPAATAPGAVPPVLQYNHGSGPFEGKSVTGGVVNRGPVKALAGNYIFGDFISGNIWSIPARDLMQRTTLSSASLTRQTDAFLPDAGTIASISSFGTDDDGNVYVVDFTDGEVFRMETP